MDDPRPAMRNPIRAFVLAPLLLAVACGGEGPNPSAPQAAALTLDIDRIAAAGADRVHWGSSLTGVWGDAVSKNEADTWGGNLILAQSQDAVTGVSTTGGSIWSGRFQKGVLKADYRVEGKYAGTVVLRLSSNGSKLSGHWESGGGTGNYTAYRVARPDAAAFAGHIREKMGDKVKIIRSQSH